MQLILHFFFLLPDLPVNEEGKCGAQHNNTGNNSDLFPLTHDNGAQNLAAKLKLCLLYTSDAADE